MFTALSPGALGLHVAGVDEAIKIAKKVGFQGVEISIHEIADRIDREGVEAVRALFDESGILPAGWGMPVDFRGDEAHYQEGLAMLPRLARAGQAIGCTRTMTWIMPCSDTMPTDEHRAFLIRRFTPIARILADHGCRFGLEFIGPKTLRESQKYPFIYRMEDMLALGDEIGPNMGLLLDAWHLFTSGGSPSDLLKVDQKRIVYVHVNDAPEGLTMDQYVDFERGLPGATGVIPIGDFLRALATIGYDGPVVPEPFGGPASWAADAMRRIWKIAGL